LNFKEVLFSSNPEDLDDHLFNIDWSSTLNYVANAINYCFLHYYIHYARMYRVK